MTAWLLDSHAFIWLVSSPERFRHLVITELSTAGSRIYVSAATAWELSIKFSLGRLELPAHPQSYIPDAMARHRLSPLAIEHRHALHVASLPRLHGDPFDRILIAQALVEDLPVLTSDPHFAAYGVNVIAP